jgi:F-type H+-transporting ATPase subunit delta
MAKLAALYAAALFELCVEKGAEDAFYDQALLVSGALSEPDARRILLHPHIITAEKQKLFGKAFENELHQDLQSFLFLVIEKNRESFFLPALAELIRLIERKRGKTKAKVISAAELSAKQSAALKKLLESKLGKEVEINLRVEPSVIGGAHILADGYFIDRTVKKRLRELTADMKERCGA